MEKTEEQMGILEVPGARLYYETHGSGQAFLMSSHASCCRLLAWTNGKTEYQSRVMLTLR